jgi:hypothetical protein
LREVEAAARRLGTGLGCELLDSYIEEADGFGEAEASDEELSS